MFVRVALKKSQNETRPSLFPHEKKICKQLILWPSLLKSCRGDDNLLKLLYNDMDHVSKEWPKAS